MLVPRLVIQRLIEAAVLLVRPTAEAVARPSGMTLLVLGLALDAAVALSLLAPIAGDRIHGAQLAAVAVAGLAVFAGFRRLSAAATSR